jgi:hypothetical protein
MTNSMEDALHRGQQQPDTKSERAPERKWLGLRPKVKLDHINLKI